MGSNFTEVSLSTLLPVASYPTNFDSGALALARSFTVMVGCVNTGTNSFGVGLWENQAPFNKRGSLSLGNGTCDDLVYSPTNNLFYAMGTQDELVVVYTLAAKATPQYRLHIVDTLTIPNTKLFVNSALGLNTNGDNLFVVSQQVTDSGSSMLLFQVNVVAVGLLSLTLALTGQPGQP